ncbi:MAG: tRNA1(Val) (adenine(37)-N6)-methyltransferase [Marinilabilia sp.]
MFHFQQFSIQQSGAAMKVGTDGVLLGAWTPLTDLPDRILDVGTGTGLVALMLAQRHPSAMIDAVEIDSQSCLDARWNFEHSPWKYRLTLFEMSFQDFSKTAGSPYDLIVCNPPFFFRSIKNTCRRKTVARHDDALDYQELLHGSRQLLHPGGQLSLILPAEGHETFRGMAARNGWFEYRRLNVKPSPGKKVKRVLSCWGLLVPEDHLASEEMVVEISRHQYSDDFYRLTRDFYLKRVFH